MFDRGAQLTYITKELNLVPFKQEKIAINIFVSTELKVQNIDVVKFIMIDSRKNVYVYSNSLFKFDSNIVISNNLSSFEKLKICSRINTIS